VKYIIISILILFSLSAYGQIEDTPLFVGKYFGNQSGGGSGYWQVTGNFTDETGYYDATSIQVGDVLFFVDAGIGYHLPVTSIISASGSSFTVRVNNDGITGVSAVPNGAGGFYRANSPKGLWPDPAGLTAPDRQTLNSFLIKRINQEPVKRDTFITVPHSTNFIPSLVVTNASRFYNNVYISAKGGTDTSTVAFLAAPNTSHYGVVYNIKADSGLVETRILSDAHLSNTKSSYLLRRGQMAQVRALPDQVQANAYKWAVNVSWDSTVVSGGGGVSDGDKGDITVSSSGATWTIDNGVVTSAKVASQTLDSTDLKNRGTTLLKLAQSGATNGQVPKFNSTTGSWEPGADNNSGGVSSNLITETVIEAIGSPSNRSDMASCIRLNGDTLLLMYEQFPGGGDDFDDYYLIKRYSYDNGATWQARQNVFATTPLPEIDRGFGIPSLLQSGDTTHLMFWGGRNYPGDPGGNYYDAKIYYTRSTNKGVTWSTPVNIQGGSDTTYHAPGSDRLVKLANGRLLYATGVLQNTTPLSSIGNYTIYRAYSDDKGVTWTYGTTGIAGVSGLAGEAGFWQLPNGVITMYFRTRDKWIYAANSTDNGATFGSIYRVLPNGNLMPTIKYIPELQMLVAAYAPGEFDANNVWETGTPSERRDLVLSFSRDGKNWSDPTLIYRGNTTSKLIVIEPSIFYNSVSKTLSVFYSPSDNTEARYSLHETKISAPTALGVGSSKVSDFLFLDRLGIGFTNQNDARPSAKIDIRRDALGGSTGDFDISMSNPAGDEIRLSDRTAGSVTLNEIYLYAKSASANNRLRVTNNNITNTNPGLLIAVDKGDGATASASSDLILQVTNGGVNQGVRMYGNGDMNIAGNLTEGTVRKSMEISATSNSERFALTGSNNGASGGYTRWGIGTATSGTYWPYFQSLPVGDFSALWEWRQTASSTSTPPLDFSFITSGGSALAANTIMQRWKSNNTTRMSVDQEGDLVANSFVGLLRPVAGTTTLASDVRISGSLLTTPVAGAFGEYDGTEFYATNSTASRTIFARVLKGSGTLDFGSTASNGESDLTITVAGVADGDVVSLGVPNASATTGVFFAWVSATNTVTVRFHNTSGGSTDPVSGTFKVTVTK